MTAFYDPLGEAVLMSNMEHIIKFTTFQLHADLICLRNFPSLTLVEVFEVYERLK